MSTLVPELVLASTSRYRRELLERLGVPFRALAPACDEAELKRAMPAGIEPAELATRLARAKAESLLEKERGAVILGSDQVVAVEGRVLSKPGTVEKARDQLAALAGREHVLATAIAVVCERHGVVERHDHLDVTRLVMRPLDAEQIDRYLAVDAPFDCAGSYRLEARGIALFERIASEDHTAIVGLPLIAVTSMLVRLGFPVP